jgi:hypothetical protein
MTDTTPEATPAEQFAAFLGAALESKANRYTITGDGETSSPREDRRKWQDIDADERDPWDSFADFLNNRLNGGPDPADIGDPESPGYDREAAIEAAIERHELDRYPAEVVEMLRGVREGTDINRAAARIAELYENAPRKPRPDRSQGRNCPDSPGDSGGRQALDNAIRDAVLRSDGSGAWQETNVRL